jgi:hypothetical protein
MGQSNKTIFKHGDKVKAHFYGDIIFTLEDMRISNMDTDIKIFYPLKISIGVGNRDEYFTIDGRSNISHYHPSLSLVEEKKEIEVIRWFQIMYHLKRDDYPKISKSLYKSKEDFLSNFDKATEDDFYFIHLGVEVFHTYKNTV